MGHLDSEAVKTSPLLRVLLGVVLVDVDELQCRGLGDRPDPGGESLDAVVFVGEGGVIPEGTVAAVLG